MGEKQRKKLLLLYASQTGNALDVAEHIGREAECRGCPASIVSTNEFDPSCLPHEEAVVFVDPLQGKETLLILLRNLGNFWLQRLRFAVFGLGDSGYQKYNVSSSASSCFAVFHKTGEDDHEWKRLNRSSPAVQSDSRLLFDSGVGYYTHEQLMQRFHFSKGDCGGLMKEGR
ncbi:hypothetical protein Bca52824_033013 [Brassica carinata]|uniref:Flavodoxin-like domain-containing protein n=1 Tax=Brassica carinata TaxID=52824 RepID=A0A8X7SE68_BRACI|nr:hypothetical protein Bca52824_033013 [Brassica carinata]